MNEIENQLRLLLQGKHFTDDLECDFTIEDQIAFVKSRHRNNSSLKPRRSAESRKSSGSRKSATKSPKAKIVTTPEGPRPTIHDPTESRAKRGSKTRKNRSPTLPVMRHTKADFSDTDEETLDDGLTQDEPPNHETEKKVYPVPGAHQNTRRSKEKRTTPTGKDGIQSGPSKAIGISLPSPAPNTASCKRFPEMMSPATHGRSVAGENIAHITLVKTDESPGKPRYIPKVNSTVNYIVAALFINQQQELLLVEESSPSRKGQWGIPAGNVQHAEDFASSFTRIMKQETGLQAQATTLLYVEQGADAWFRFVMSGKILGGTLKNSPDSFTLQAKWVKSTEGMKLRGGDEFKDILQCGKDYFKNIATQEWHANLLPVRNQHNRLYARIIYCLLNSPNAIVRILLMRRESYHFPVCEFHPDKTLKEVLATFFGKLFGSRNVPERKTHGVLCVEHSPSTASNVNDGVCITLLCSCQKQFEQMSHMEEFLWLEVSQELGEQLLRRMQPNMCVKWRVISR